MTAPRIASRLSRLGVPLLLAGALLMGSIPRAEAAPVRIALAAEAGDGSWRFLSDLAQLWRNRYEPTDEQLAVRTMDGAEARLRAVNRGRGDFAVVDVRTAVAHLAEFPRLTTLAVLWPNLLYAVTRNPDVHALQLPIPAELWALHNADFALQSLTDLTSSDPTQTALLHPVPDDILDDALQYAHVPILVFTAPTPLQDLQSAMSRDATLRILPIDGKIVDGLKQADPWMATAKLPRLTYPGQSRTLELPALYEVLVGRSDLPAPTVDKVLDTVYGSANAMSLFDPLFGQTDPSMNAVFAKLLPFHPETARRYNFTPSVH